MCVLTDDLIITAINDPRHSNFDASEKNVKTIGHNHWNEIRMNVMVQAHFTHGVVRSPFRSMISPILFVMLTGALEVSLEW